MKRFILKSTLYGGWVLLIYFIAGYCADGYTDPFYVRFTTPRQSSMIIGTSRAAQGLQPALFDSLLQKYHCRMNNFSFTVMHSPFGKVYLDAIKKKLNYEGKAGIFVVTVDPWAVASSSNDPEDESLFREKKQFLNKVFLYNVKPNYNYLFSNYRKKWAGLLYARFTRGRSSMFLHDDGWLEVSVPVDSSLVATRVREKVKWYKESMLPRFKSSVKRWKYLEKTIVFLQDYGTVFLVRLPVHKDIRAIDNLLIPDFDRMVETIAQKYHISFYDFSSNDEHYIYTDGNHLCRKSGAEVTRKIASLIRNDLETGKTRQLRIVD